MVGLHAPSRVENPVLIVAFNDCGRIVHPNATAAQLRLSLGFFGRQGGGWTEASLGERRAACEADYSQQQQSTRVCERNSMVTFLHVQTGRLSVHGSSLFSETFRAEKVIQNQARLFPDQTQR